MIGAAVCVGLALLVAAIDSWGRVIGVAIFYVIYLNVENSFLTPRIMKSSVNLPGWAILVALLIGSALEGVLGAMVSVPTAVLVAVLLDEYLSLIHIYANYAPYSTAFGTPSSSATSIADRRPFDPCVGACPTGAAAINSATGILGASIVDLLSNLTGNYHSLQVSASKQLSSNFSVNGFYVWSRAMDSFCLLYTSRCV